MGVNVADFRYITPYEFNLLREGYQVKQETDWRIAKYIAWNNYAMQATPEDRVPMDEFHPIFLSDQIKKKKAKPIAAARKISAKKKAELEAKVNSMS
jgi:hypothetical protein